MSIFVIGMLVFVTTLGVALFLTQPLFTQYVESYAVRVRPRKEVPELTDLQPRSSTLLKLCATIGEIALDFLPGIVDKQTLQLLVIAIISSSHLAIYMGIRTMFAGSCLSLCLLNCVANPACCSPYQRQCLDCCTEFFLAGRAKKRQNQIIRELPTIGDLLVVCAQAGVSLMEPSTKSTKRWIHVLCSASRYNN